MDKLKVLSYIGRRLLYLVPQALGVSIVTFVVVRTLPGDPAVAIAGPRATAEMIARLRTEMGLDRPLWEQYFLYLRNISKGDFGRSWVTSNPVLTDIAHRAPATLELVTYGLLFSIIIGIPLGVLAVVSRRRGLLRVGVGAYSGLAGAMPDFWLGLLLIFVFYFLLRWAPSPVGRIDLMVIPPEPVTGFLTIDSLIAGDMEAFRSAVGHLILPVATLVLVYMAPIVKMTRSSMEKAMAADHIAYAQALGLKSRTVTFRALRNALPPVVTIIGVIYGFLLGGAVLVENIFAWGGLGQYAVQSIVNSDFAAIQAFVLIAAIFTLFVYLAVDLAYMALDPRVRQ